MHSAATPALAHRARIRRSASGTHAPGQLAQRDAGERVGAGGRELEVDGPVGVAEADDGGAVIQAADPGIGQRLTVGVQRPVQVDYERELGPTGAPASSNWRA